MVSRPRRRPRSRNRQMEFVKHDAKRIEDEGEHEDAYKHEYEQGF